MNSINWARIAAQIPYYVAAALALGAPDREVAFSVPTGNFGNVLAAWAARRMGLPVARLIVGSNRNDILARFLAANDMSIARGRADAVAQHGHPGQLQLRAPAVRAAGPRRRTRPRETMPAFRTTGRMAVPDAAWHRAAAVFHGFRLDDPGTEAEIAGCIRRCGYLADPHTAIGIAAARATAARHGGCRWWRWRRRIRRSSPTRWSGRPASAPPLPPRMADLFEREERFTVLPNDLAAVEAQVRALARRNV